MAYRIGVSAAAISADAEIPEYIGQPLMRPTRDYVQRVFWASQSRKLMIVLNLYTTFMFALRERRSCLCELP